MAIAQRWPPDTIIDRPDVPPVRSEAAVPRVLIADDQADVLEALRLLLKGEGYRIESAGSPAAILEAIDARRVRRRVDGPQLRTRHDVRPGGARPAVADPPSRQHAAGRRHDRVGQRRGGGGSDAARRARLRAEAVGERAPADDRAHAGGTGARAAAPAAARGREPIAEARYPSAAHRRRRLDAPGARADSPRRAVGSQRAHHRRERHRQRHRRAGDSLRVRPRGQRAGDGERRRTVGGPLRERAVRPREGRLHRREDRPGRPLRARRRRHAVPRRDRERAAEPAAQAAARAGDGRFRAGRIVAHAPGQRPHRLRHEREPRRRSGQRTLPPGSAVPPEHDRDSRCPRCAIGARTSPRWLALSSSSTRSGTART